MKKLLLLLSISMLATASVFATHNRAGEITYKWIGVNYTDYTYQVTVTTYTNTYMTSADRCEVTVYFGDGDSAIAPRINGPTGSCPDLSEGYGVSLSAFPNTKLNIYRTQHTYGGAGIYTMTMTDPNRNAGTCNIDNGNSVNIPFCLQSQLLINPFLGHDDSPQLLNIPLDEACYGVCFSHNPGAWDTNDDSLYYTLDTCFMAPGVHVPNYTMPPNLHLNDIDHFRGDITWCSPNFCCPYNIAILIKSYRRLPGHPERYYIGYVLRDMQISVECTCVLNTPPVITSLLDTCITAGTLLHFTVSATDAQNYGMTLEANGGPFHITPTATFASTPSTSPVTGTFNWTPNCSEVELLPYLVTFKASDGDPHQLIDYQSMLIRVVAPAPTGLTATPSGSTITVVWADAACHNTIGNNPLFGYYVYRKESCDPWTHNPCETGLPSISGYTLIGTTGPTTTIFTDNNGGAGLTNGINYSYIVVAFYSDGSQSYASDNVCAMLVRDVPIITNVSVTATDASAGAIWTHWIKPLAALPNLDTVANPPPYRFRLMRARGYTGALIFDSVATFSYNSFSAITDTGFISTGINTLDYPYTFRIDFYSGTHLVGSTNTASSVFLATTPLGNSMQLNWTTYVPWLNYRHKIFRLNAVTLVFDSIGSSITNSFLDTGLTNGRLYCYKVETQGEYTDLTIPRPLFNFSQERCDKPVDLIPPCQPAFMVENDCGIFQNILSWTNPNTYCSHDAVGYNIYFARTTDEQLELIYSINDVNVTTYTHVYLYEGVPSVAGCYAVTALDTFHNESPVINKTCVDNCPEYELPNVFTPNGDGINDLVTPLPGYRYVRDVDMKIFDRWGLLMFETKDKDILWDGKNKDTKVLCPDGTYFYVCTVNEIRVDGITPRVLKGFIQLFHNKSEPSR